MTTAVSDISGCVLVPIELLRRLEELEVQLPTLLEKAKSDRDKEKLDALHAAAKENPQEASAKALKRYYRNRDAINARRREAYRAKKETAAKAAPS